MSMFPEAHIPSYVTDALPGETEKEFNQRIRLETQEKNERNQAEWGAPKVVYVEKEVVVEEKHEITQEEKDAIIAEYIAEVKAQKAAERKAKAEAKKADE